MSRRFFLRERRLPCAHFRTGIRRVLAIRPRRRCAGLRAEVQIAHRGMDAQTSAQVGDTAVAASNRVRGQQEGDGVAAFRKDAWKLFAPDARLHAGRELIAMNVVDRDSDRVFATDPFGPLADQRMRERTERTALMLRSFFGESTIAGQRTARLLESGHERLARGDRTTPVAIS